MCTVGTIHSILHEEWLAWLRHITLINLLFNQLRQLRFLDMCTAHMCTHSLAHTTGLSRLFIDQCRVVGLTLSHGSGHWPSDLKVSVQPHPPAAMLGVSSQQCWWPFWRMSCFMSTSASHTAFRSAWLLWTEMTLWFLFIMSSFMCVYMYFSDFGLRGVCNCITTPPGHDGVCCPSLCCSDKSCSHKHTHTHAHTHPPTHTPKP